MKQKKSNIIHNTNINIQNIISKIIFYLLILIQKQRVIYNEKNVN